MGKYVSFEDSYKSLNEALTHGGFAHDLRVVRRWVEAEELEHSNAAEKLGEVDGILVPGGFGPRGTGGMVAAAVDNTLGPLSVLVAPPNVTHRLEMTYSRPVTLDIGHVIVRARLIERQGRRLLFRADVRSPEGLRLARSKAVHWIIDE